MSEVQASIDIAAPPAEVWAMAMDPDRLRPGYEMEQTLCLRGVNFKVHWELVHCDRPFHAEWHGRGPARSHAETEYRLAATGEGGTRFAYRNEFRAPLGPLGAMA